MFIFYVSSKTETFTNVDGRRGVTGDESFDRQVLRGDTVGLEEYVSRYTSCVGRVGGGEVRVWRSVKMPQSTGTTLLLTPTP